MVEQNNFHIAIDGPVAAGKGTIAKLLAQRLGFLYVDTGAMYRTAAVIAAREGVDFADQQKVADLVKAADIDMYDVRDLETNEISSIIKLNDEDISKLIRTREIDGLVPVVAAMAPVREVLVEKQQQIASNKNVVMEGRDISYRVLPDAELKIFLTADVKERARRRLEQYRMRGNETITFEEVLAETEKRDEIDSNRATDPLKQVEGSWLIDTTNIDIDGAIEKILAKVAELRTES